MIEEIRTMQRTVSGLDEKMKSMSAMASSEELNNEIAKLEAMIVASEGVAHEDNEGILP